MGWTKRNNGDAMSGSVNYPAGWLQPTDFWGVYNNLRFAIRQALSKVQTASLVQVQACTNEGGISPVGTVDVVIMVNQITSQSVSVPHVTMKRLPYLRVQGGANAVIIDPQPGDIGIAVFASRDITKVKNTRAQANPGSFRMHDFGDGLYLGGVLNGTPNQYVQFIGSGISIVSPTAITLQAPTVIIEGDLQQSGGVATIAQTLEVAGDVTANGISVSTHVHSGVTAGSAVTGEPV